MRLAVLTVGIALATAGSHAAPVQFPRVLKDRIPKVVQKVSEFQISEQDEIRLGAEISARVRQRYGVVQDPKVHEYVGLAGNLLVRTSTRKDLPFHFIVLDTDGVNAFAAPGGYIHISRGALALLRDESQLAGVLGHEIIHVTEKHTIRAIQKGKMIQFGTDKAPTASNPEIFRQLVDVGTRLVMAGFSTSEELESDAEAVPLTAKVGYAPQGLAEFLRFLKQRNTDSEVKQGLFASHPEMDERLKKLDALAKDLKTAGGAVLQDRYARWIQYKPVSLDDLALATEGVRGLVGGQSGSQQEEKDKGKDKKDDTSSGDKKPSRFSLSRLSNPLGGGGETKQSAAVTGSGASRGLDREREAKGGPNAAEVPVTVTAEMLEKFRKEGNLKPIV